MQVALLFTKHAVSPALRLSCRAERGSGRVGDPPPTVDTPRETQGLSRVTAPSVSLKFFHLQLFL